MTALFETHLTVADVPRSIAFYRDVVGLELAYELPERGAAFFWVGGRGQGLLGLWSLGSAPMGMSLHIAFRVPLDDVTAACERLAERGIAPLSFFGEPATEPSVIGWMPAAAVYFRDPDGHQLEYLAMLDDAPAPERGIVPWSQWTKRSIRMGDASPVVALGPAEQAIARRLMDALDRFNADTTGIADARELLVTELGENDELLGGLHGWTWGATCWIESLWVREDMRGSGLGGRLMGAVERLARDRGCLQLALETHSFQAPGFYRRHGFEVVGTLPDYPVGHDHLTMRKPLADAPRPARGSVEIRMHHGPRAGLRPLFELADDSPVQLDAYLDAGRVLIAVDDGRTVGHLQLTETAGTLEIKNMAVLESHQRHGVGRTLMHAAIDLARDDGHAVLTVATAAADIGNLRFYQRLGFRMRRIERDAFTETTGYQPQDVAGIALRDRVWLDLDLHSADRAAA